MCHCEVTIPPANPPPEVTCPYASMQGSIDASGICCYGTVDSFGVCNGWDASGQISITLLAGSASLASTSAVAGYLGVSVSAVHAVSPSNG